MLITHLTENVHDDTRVRRLGQDVLRSLIDHIDEHGLSYTRPLTAMGVKGVFFPVEVLGDYDELSNLKIGFIPEFNESPDVIRMAAYSHQMNMIIIFIDPHGKMGITEYQHWHDAFIHEFIHHVDFQRAPGMFGDSIKNDNYSDYVNSPVELNAFYHQALDIFETFLDSIRSRSNYSKLVSMLFPTPEKFVQFVLNRLPGDIIDNLSEQNKRRFKKRLYQYYVEHEDTINNG